jgi:Ankyrin repeat
MNTPLHEAAEEGHIDVCKLLLVAGAVVNNEKDKVSLFEVEVVEVVYGLRIKILFSVMLRSVFLVITAVTLSNDYSSHLSLHIICHRMGICHFTRLPTRVILRYANCCCKRSFRGRNSISSRRVEIENWFSALFN